MDIELFFTSFNLECGKIDRSKTSILCVAHFGGKKKPMPCCNNGKTKLPFFPDPPLLLKNLWRDDTPEARIFREYARYLNNAFALTSHTVHEVIPAGGFNPSVIIQGRVSHFIGPLRATAGETPRFAQIWVHDPVQDHEDARIRLGNIILQPGTSQRVRDILSQLLARIRVVLRRENRYIQDFITASEIPPDQLGNARMVLNTSARPVDGHSRVYNTNLIEVAVMMNENPGPRDIVLHQRGGGPQNISDTHRSFDALHFVLLHPLSHDGWHLQLLQVEPSQRTREGAPVYTNKRLTARQFYSYHLQSRPGKSDAILRGCLSFKSI